MSDWELDVAELNGTSHGDATVPGEAPRPGTWDFSDQAMSMTAIENARDFGALPVWIGDVFQMRRALEFLADVAIGESTDHVLPVKQGEEDLCFVASRFSTQSEANGS